MFRKRFPVWAAFAMLAQTLFAQSGELIGSAKLLLEREDLQAYRGWIKYLIFDVEAVSVRPNVDEAKVLEKRARLASWVRRIEADSNVIATLRGVQEWAYESPADGSGQPFIVNIPHDYDSSLATPLSLYMHGYTGDHVAHYSGSEDLRGMFELSVLGRSRGGGYMGLSGADVIHVLDYVEQHWNIDADHVHLLGGSMGGQGTFRIGSRYPHRFASGRPTCGFASAMPFGNLLTLPMYAIHSDDDMTVPILHAQGPLDRLRQLGGQAVFDWTTGYGHASWNYAEGNARAGRWFREQVRPGSKGVRNINYTALDGAATRSWWAEVEEWGARAKPAKFILKAGDSNMLYATLENVSQLKLRIPDSPFDPAQRLQVSVNGEPFIEMDAPLPKEVYLKNKDGAWALSNRIDSRWARQHKHERPNLLYDGNPLLIVYGTQGDDATNLALRTAAESASHSSNAGWVVPNGDIDADGIHHNQNLYGSLRVKADTEVLADDIARCHLVLIGTAQQNSLVASIADRLPVSVSEHEIAFSDGESYSADGLGLGLVYYNPDSPERLIYWVASNDNRLYREGSPIPEQMSLQFSFYGSAAPGYDCLVSAVDRPSFVAMRSFDSAWAWNPRSVADKRVSTGIATSSDLLVALADAIRAEMGADFSYSEAFADGARVIRPGKTRLEDFASYFFYEPLVEMTVSGTEALEIQSKLKAAGESLYPKPDTDKIDPESEYVIATNQASLWNFVKQIKFAPRDYRLTDTQLSTAVERYFPVE